ncbi:MAG: DUF554 domain-containing protein [Oscillospiraceae bacterium]|nr:DUF554 domain-containing protein [Oscillospiraceae bacterium]
MIMLGTVVNAAAVVIGGGAGMIIKKGLKEDFRDSLMKTLGVAVIFLGAAGAMPGLLELKDGALQTRGTMLMILSLTLGIIAGELLKIEDRMETLGEKLKKLVRAEGDNLFVQGFVTNALVICVGAMAVVGALQDGINHDPSTLFAKAVLDAMISMVFAASLGVGVLFAAVPLFLYQGAITLLAGFAAPFFTDEVIGNLSYIGNILIAVVGVNLLFGKTVKVGNMLPALIFAVILGYFM